MSKEEPFSDSKMFYSRLLDHGSPWFSDETIERIGRMVSEIGVERARGKLRAALTAVVGGLAIFGVKLLAYSMSGSEALISDALEPVVNIAASTLMMFPSASRICPRTRTINTGTRRSRTFLA